MLKTNELYKAVAKRVDTEGTKINAAETSRVCSCLFTEIVNLIEFNDNVSECDAVVWFAKELSKHIEKRLAERDKEA